MDCDVHAVSALWWTFGGIARCPECGKTVRPKEIEYGTASGVMAALLKEYASKIRLAKED